MDKLLTIAEISKQVGIPESTVRYYRDKFEPFFPTVGKGRNRRYRPEAIDIVKVIAEGFNRNMTAMEIEEGLTRMFSMDVSVVEQTAATTTATQQQSLEEIKSALLQTVTTIGTLNQTVQKLSNRIEELETEKQGFSEQQKEVAELRRTIAELRNKEASRLHESEKSTLQLVQRIERLEQQKPWWKVW